MPTRYIRIVLLLPITVAAWAQAPAARIRAEGMQHSQVMEIASQLTDRVGPRLTDSSGLRAAQANALALLQDWGITGHLEEWSGFGRGWEVTRFDAEQLAPAYSPLIAYAKAWSTGTAGTVEGEPVYFDTADAAGRAELPRQAGGARGAVPAAAYLSDHHAAQALERSRVAATCRGTEPPLRPVEPKRSANREAMGTAKWKLLFAERPAVVIEPGTGEGGTVYVTAAHAAGGKDPWAPDAGYLPPQMVMAAEQYNRLVRLVAAHLSARMRIAIDVNFDTSLYARQPDC